LSISTVFGLCLVGNVPGACTVAGLLKTDLHGYRESSFKATKLNIKTYASYCVRHRVTNRWFSLYRDRTLSLSHIRRLCCLLFFLLKPEALFHCMQRGVWRILNLLSNGVLKQLFTPGEVHSFCSKGMCQGQNVCTLAGNYTQTISTVLLGYEANLKQPLSQNL